MLAAAGALASPASALDPARTLTEARAQSWGLREGAPVVVNALAQGRDGYLLIAGQQGLFRFDGLRFERMPALPGQNRSNEVNALLAARNGDLWVGHDWGGVSLLRNNQPVDAGYKNPTGSVLAIEEGIQGDIWVATIGLRSRVWHRTAKGWENPITIGTSSVPWIAGMAVDRAGSVWIALEQNELLVIRSGTRQIVGTGLKFGRNPKVAQDNVGRIWVTDVHGLHLVTHGGRHLTTVLNGKAIGQPANGEIRQLFFDRENTAWIAAQGGLTRIRLDDAGKPSAIEHHTSEGGLTQSSTHPVIEDRENGIWSGTAAGLERFGDAAIVQDASLPRSKTGLFAWQSSTGRLYVASSSVLYRLEDNGTWHHVVALERAPIAMCEDKQGALFFGAQAPLLRLANGKISRISAPMLGKARFMLNCAFDTSGRLWLRVFPRGIYSSANGGRTWLNDPASEKTSFFSAAHDSGRQPLSYSSFSSLDVLDGNKWRPLMRHAQNPLGLIRAIFRDNGQIYLCGDYGLGRLVKGRLSILPAARFPVLRQLSDMIRTADGASWVLSQAGIIRFDTRALERAFDDPSASLHGTLLDWRDGLPGPPDVSRSESDFLAEGPDHRVMVLANDKVAWIDPLRIGRIDVAPKALIHSISVDGRELMTDGSAQLPAGASRVQIGFTAPGFADPSGMRFRYRLEGFDTNWIDSGSDRIAVYTNIKPGKYRFRVSAANRNGAWDPEGAQLGLTLPPTFSQSWTFLILCLCAAAVTLWVAYAMRVRAVASRIKARSEERIAERERIARELHDTLLQGFQGLMLRFQSVANRISSDQPTKLLLNQALDRAETVLVEGRDRVRDLRSSHAHSDFYEGLRSVAERVFTGETLPKLLFTMTGRRRALHAATHHEALSIVEEALRNASLHAHPRRILVRVDYSWRAFRVVVMDDGIGIAPGICDVGKAGHFGIVGMKERAIKIGGALKVRNAGVGGTEVVLRVPARTAYAAKTGKLASSLLRQPLAAQEG